MAVTAALGKWHWLAMGCACCAVAGVAAAGVLTTDVQVKVRLVSSSGTCGTVASAPTVQVTCQPSGSQSGEGQSAEAPLPRGPLLPDPGEVPYQRAGAVQVAAIGVAKEPLEVYSVGTKITSWRIVQLDNARYLELTIAW
jgi:hypothetical protein